MIIPDPSRMVYRYLDTVGDGSGTKDAIGNMIGTPLKFTATEDSAIYRMIIYIEDGNGFKASLYGALPSLTNGWELKVKDSGDNTLLDLTDGISIHHNSQIGQVCFDVDVKDWGAGAGNEGLIARWTFERSGSPIFLTAGNSLVVELNDNFTGLVHHTFAVQGFVATQRTTEILSA